MYLLLSLTCAEPLQFYCENITYKYLLQKGERLREYHRVSTGRSRNTGRRSSHSSCSTGYLEFYRELILNKSTCLTNEVNQITEDNDLLEVSSRNQEKEWTKNFASPECGSKLGKI